MKIELLTSSDISAAMRLVETAGWNQTPVDWHRLINYAPTGCFKAMVDGQLVGTVTTTAYGQEIGWIGMMLVAPEARRQGIGTMLMQKAMARLQSDGVSTIWLDATPMGQPVYERLGFQHLYSFHRWQRPPILTELKKDHFLKHKLTIDIQSQITEQHLQIDQMKFGFDRRHWLNRFIKDTSFYHTIHGFGMIRRGRLSHYLGPIIANDQRAAIDIVDRLITETQEGIIIDYPGNDTAYMDFLSQSGFQPVRTLARMWHGRQPIKNAFQMQYGISDPATG